jgi:hypothetical protein
MPLDATEYKDDRCPPISIRRGGATLGGPPLNQVGVQHRQPTQPFLTTKRLVPNITGHQAADQQMLQCLLLLIAKRESHRVRKNLTLQLVCGSTPIL